MSERLLGQSSLQICEFLLKSTELGGGPGVQRQVSEVLHERSAFDVQIEICVHQPLVHVDGRAPAEVARAAVEAVRPVMSAPARVVTDQPGRSLHAPRTEPPPKSGWPVERAREAPEPLMESTLSDAAIPVRRS